MPTSAEWPALHKDNQRSNYTDEIVRGPYQRKWFRSIVDEMIGTRNEAIVAKQLCIVGTVKRAVDSTDNPCTVGQLCIVSNFYCRVYFSSLFSD